MEIILPNGAQGVARRRRRRFEAASRRVLSALGVA